jgi:hypothetical protein
MRNDNHALDFCVDTLVWAGLFFFLTERAGTAFRHLFEHKIFGFEFWNNYLIKITTVTRN